MRFFTVPAKTKAPSGRRISGRSKRNELSPRKSSSASVLASLQDLVAVGKAAEALDHRDVPVEDLVKGVQRVIRRQFVHRPAPLLHAQVLVVQRLGMGQHQAEEDPLDRAQALR